MPKPISITRLEFLEKTWHQPVANGFDPFWLNALLREPIIELTPPILAGLRARFPNVKFTKRVVSP